jgi:hypothetical protein
MSESKTSEELRGLPEQPQDTCPMIDKAQKIIAKLSSRVKGYKKVDDAEELREMLSDVDWDIDISGDLEDIRQNTSNIRAWGQAWKDLAKELESQLEQAKKGAERYEYIRKMHPHAFAHLWRKNINGEGLFDDLVDAVMQEGK